MADQPFITDIQTLRARARQHIEQGAVTAGYRADRETVIRLLNEALATEIVCVLRYKPTVCLDVTSAVARSCGHNSGQIEQRVAH